MAADPADLLRRHALRVTPQRRAILAAFAGGADEHLSAEEVHALARREIPELGRGTVYATLAELTELGLLGVYGAPEPVRYEINSEPHDHFRCRLCMRFFDVTVPRPSTATLVKAGFTIEAVAVLAEGVCAECNLYEKGLEDGARSLLEHRQVEQATLDTLACSRLDTVLGPLALAASEVGVVRIAFADHADFDPFVDRASTRRGSRQARRRLDHAAEAIAAFLGGSEGQAEDVLDLLGHPLAEGGLLEGTRQVPYGATISYERLESELDAYRRGHVFGSNPMPVLFPCHRVTRGVEQPPAYVGGAARREQLLALERAELRGA